MDAGQERSHAIEMVFIVSDLAWWGFSHKFHVIIVSNFSFLSLNLRSGQSPVTKCPHLPYMAAYSTFFLF